MKEKEREDRRCNIVIKEIEMKEEIGRKEGEGELWVEELIKDRLGIECRVEKFRKSRVIVAKIVGEEKGRDDEEQV